MLHILRSNRIIIYHRGRYQSLMLRVNNQSKYGVHIIDHLLTDNGDCDLGHQVSTYRVDLFHGRDVMVTESKLVFIRYSIPVPRSPSCSK